jgi:hypothetical protein
MTYHNDLEHLDEEQKEDTALALQETATAIIQELYN